MLKMTTLATLLLLTGAHAMATPADDRFVRHEARGSAYELAFARLGQERAIRPEVRAYAAMLVNDHEVYGSALRHLAESKGIAFPSGLTADDRKRLDGLTRTRRAGFDGAFVREARRINREEVRANRKEAGRTVDPEIHSFVDRFLEVEKKHEQAARALTEHALASASPVIQPPPTGDTMAVVPPPSSSTMPVIAPPPKARK